jgi:glucose/mannose-6-phosphate isomerase
LIDYSLFKKFDPSGMHKIYDKWSDIAIQSYESGNDSIEYQDIDHIIFAGMGGSGTIGDIFSSILSKTNVHVCVVKGYHLPKTVDSNTLVVTVSISGNTIETLTILNAAKKIGSKIIAFSGGGKMERYCEKNHIEYRKIPQIHSPRASFTTYLYSLLGYLATVTPIKKYDIIDSIKKLEILQKLISSDNLTKTNPSLELAKWITGLPMIYYPWGLQAAAIRFKNSLQENAKFHAMSEDVVEACHNGIVAWEKNSNVRPILIQGMDDYVKTKEVWKILKRYFEENDIDYWDVVAQKGGILSKLINLIYMLDYASIYLAVLNKIDPTPIIPINYVKKHMQKFQF